VCGEERQQKTHAQTRFFMHAQSGTAELILIKFCTSTPWANTVIYLKRYPNWSKGLGGGSLGRGDKFRLSHWL